MTHNEMIGKLAAMISPDTASDDILLHLLNQAEGIVLNRRYPFGPPADAVLPVHYEHIALRIAVELFSKMGAEGQVEHNENGVQRKWEAGDVSPSLLKAIVPLCGSVSQ